MRGELSAGDQEQQSLVAARTRQRSLSAPEGLSPRGSAAGADGATGAVAGLLDKAVKKSQQGEQAGDTDEGSVSLFWACTTLAVSTIGTGMLALPSSFACLGLLPALGLLLLTALGMYFTGVLLIKCFLVMEGTATTYGEFAEHVEHAFTHPRNGSGAATDPTARRRFANLVPIVVTIGLFGGGCAYVTLAKEVLPALLQAVGAASTTAGSPVRWWWSTELWTAALLFGIAGPLCFMKHIGSLRYSSALGVSRPWANHCQFRTLTLFLSPTFQNPPTFFFVEKWIGKQRPLGPMRNTQPANVPVHSFTIRLFKYKVHHF